MAYISSTAQLESWLEAGLAAHQQGDLPRALAAYRQVLAAAPGHAGASNLLGTALLQSGEPGEALAHLERAARKQGSNPHLLANLAQAYLGLQRYAEAFARFQRASRLDSGVVHFQVGAATALALQKKLADAQALLERAAKRFPGEPLVWFNLGNVLRDRGEADEAIAAYGKACELEPRYLDARNSIGSLLHGLQRFVQAEAHYRACLAIDPGYWPARFNLASVIIDLGRFNEAEAVCRELISAAPETPEGHTFLGAAVGHQGRLLESVACHAEAARLSAGDARADAIYGSSLMEVGRAPEGRRRLADAIDADPLQDAPRQMLASALLAHGRLQDAWADYRTRPSAVRFRQKYPQLALADTLPGNLAGRSICVLREQGLGDELFFLRYARVLAERGARITYRATSKIAGMVSRLPFLASVHDESVPFPDADIYILLGELPHALGARASEPLPPRGKPRRPALRALGESIRLYWPAIPESIALEPLPQRMDEVRARLAALGPPPYVGVTWRAGTRPEDQSSVNWVLYKEVAMAALASALQGARGTFVALQRLPAPGEIDTLARALGRPVHDLTAYNEDLEGMLGVLALIDEYVAVSNTNVHLRAAVGRTARVLVPVPAEWRWMQSGARSPWFDGFAIYRQSLQGDWNPALAALGRDLEMKSGAPARPDSPR